MAQIIVYAIDLVIISQERKKNRGINTYIETRNRV